MVVGWLLAFTIPFARADQRKAADFVIIVNRDNPSSELASELVAEAFLKKTTRWSNGETIRPVDLPADSGVRRRFSEGVLKRSVAAVRSYWQQRIFTGRDVPPPELASDEAVVRYVAKYPGAIGYVAPDTQADGVKVVLLRVK
jgi:ABC-type phosphate transport system substrate-binding protein